MNDISIRQKFKIGDKVQIKEYKKPFLLYVVRIWSSRANGFLYELSVDENNCFFIYRDRTFDEGEIEEYEG